MAFSALVSDANFACPALQISRWTAKWVPTFAYEFNDDNAPLRYPPPLTGPPVATHKSEFPYLFDLPDAPLQEPLSPDQQALAASMRAAWANFAATGNPASAGVPWPAFGDADNAPVLSSCRHSRRPRPTSPPGTTARSGPPGNAAASAAGQAATCRPPLSASAMASSKLSARPSA